MLEIHRKIKMDQFNTRRKKKKKKKKNRKKKKRKTNMNDFKR